MCWLIPLLHLIPLVTTACCSFPLTTMISWCVVYHSRTSPQIGHIPYGAAVTVTERAFSEFPTDKCIERLRLAPGTSFCNGIGAGWISVRLNKKSPEDRLIVGLYSLHIFLGSTVVVSSVVFFVEPRKVSFH